MSLKEQLINKFNLCSSNNCLEELSLQAFEIVDDKPELKLPCRRVPNNGEFEVKNPRGHLLHFLKIDHCIQFTTHCVLSKKDGSNENRWRKCDFAVFRDNEMIFVELKKIEIGSVSNSRKRRGKREDAYDQLECTLQLFLKSGIDLSNYQQSQKLFVIASILDCNPPVNKIHAVKTANLNAQVRFEGYNAILWTGHSYQFS